MPAPFFTTNPSEFTRLEGLYISEQDPPGFISGVSLNNVGVIGQTVRGPVNTPVDIGSPARFLEVFGGRDQGGASDPLINQVWRFLLNKPFGQVTVVRAAAAAAAAASMNVETLLDGTGVEVATIAASSVGAWGNNVKVRVETASDGDANHWNLVVDYLGQVVTYENLDTTTGNDNTASVIGDDIARFVTVTKLADGRPSNFADITETEFVAARDTNNFVSLGETLTNYTTVAGAEGTIAASDYTTAGTGPIDVISNYRGVSVVAAAEDSATIVPTINTQFVTNSATVSDRIFLIWSGDHTDSVSDIQTYQGTLTRSDRIVHCYNSPYTLDPDTALQIQTPPVEWMASILSQTDVDIHPGEEAAKRFASGITKLTNEALTRSDYINLRDAGVSALEKDDGFVFVSGVTTSLVAGKTEITRRRMTDFLQLSAANRLRFFVKKKNTPQCRRQIRTELTNFCLGLRDSGRIVAARNEDPDFPESFEIDQDSVNTASTRAQGIECILWRVKLVSHKLHLVLKTEIGTGVTLAA
jgi:hypothetical protein